MIEYIRVKNLSGGHVLARTLYDEQGRILLKTGNIISDRTIRFISEMGYKGVYVEHDGEERIESIPIPEPLISDEQRINTIMLIKEVYENQEKFRSPFDSHFTISRKKLEKFVEEFVDDISELDKSGKFMLELEDSGCIANYIYTHSLNTCIIAAGIALKMGFDKRTICEIALAGLYHDMGKGHLSPLIVLEPNLSRENKDLIRGHSDIMFRLLQKVNYPVNVTYGVWQHHEKATGEGYPNGLVNDKITVSARIVALASKLDNLISTSPYRDAPLLQSDAIEMLLGCGHYDTECLVAMNKFVMPYGIGTTVHLSNGEKGLVLKNIANYPLRPYVLIGKKYINLSEDMDYRNVVIENCS